MATHTHGCGTEGSNDKENTILGCDVHVMDTKKVSRSILKSTMVLAGTCLGD